MSQYTMSNQPTYKGDLEGFPAEVVEKMLERQFEQTGKRNISVFENERTSDLLEKGFTWGESTEDFDFWNEVICDKNFDVFFERYPKTEPRPESPDLHKHIADLKSQLDLAVKALEKFIILNPNHYKDIAGLINNASDTLTQIKGVN